VLGVSRPRAGICLATAQRHSFVGIFVGNFVEELHHEPCITSYLLLIRNYRPTCWSFSRRRSKAVFHLVFRVYCLEFGVQIPNEGDMFYETLEPSCAATFAQHGLSKCILLRLLIAFSRTGSNSELRTPNSEFRMCGGWTFEICKGRSTKFPTKFPTKECTWVTLNRYHPLGWGPQTRLKPGHQTQGRPRPG
jgi:hypothetical protein